MKRFKMNADINPAYLHEYFFVIIAIANYNFYLILSHNKTSKHYGNLAFPAIAALLSLENNRA